MKRYTPAWVIFIGFVTLLTWHYGPPVLIAIGLFIAFLVVCALMLLNPK